MFKHNLLPREELKTITTKQGRIYQTPFGPFPSVTTIINQAMDKSGLIKWRNSIGNEVADQILTQAQTRGREIHNLCERYVMNDPDYRLGAMPVNLETFLKIKPIVDENLEEVYGLELPLYSKILRTGGTTDMVGKWSGQNAIIDYKTSRKSKTEDNCFHYMIQGTAYALMMYERYKIEVPWVVVIIAVDDENNPLVYAVPTTKYCSQVMDIFVTRRQDEKIQAIQDG